TVAACAPYGSGNEKPCFVFEQVTIAAIKQFGKGKEHVELKLEDATGRTVTAISFFTSVNDFNEPLVAGKQVTLTGTLDQAQGYYGSGIRIRIEHIIV
ncbi:MAG TPA: hypothetical protein VLB02_00085, partial [Candidatus Paceibacterota bacterium]|nr:hypothetical protein [Candidatus Paceibacterota bacterium]